MKFVTAKPSPTLFQRVSLSFNLLSWCRPTQVVALREHDAGLSGLGPSRHFEFHQRVRSVLVGRSPCWIHFIIIILVDGSTALLVSIIWCAILAGGGGGGVPGSFSPFSRQRTGRVESWSRSSRAPLD